MAEKKTKLEIVVMPIALALIGIGSTWSITTFQAKHTAAMTAATIEAAKIQSREDRQSSERLATNDQRVKLIEVFQQKLTAPERPQDLDLALKLILAVDPELGGLVARTIAGRDGSETTEKIVGQIQHDAAEAETIGLVLAFSGPDRIAASDRLVRLYEEFPQRRSFIVQTLIRSLRADLDELSFQVNIYIAYTLSQFRPPWTCTPDQQRAVRALETMRHPEDNSAFQLRVKEALENCQS